MSRFMQRSEEPTVEVIVGVTGQDAMIGRSQRGAKGMLGDIESTSIEVETDCLSDPTTQLLLAFDREVFGHPILPMAVSSPEGVVAPVPLRDS